MKKTPLATTKPDASASRLTPGGDQSKPRRGHNFFLASLALLIVLLLIIGWAGLTRQFHSGSPAALTTGSIAAAKTTTQSAQIEPPRRDSTLAYDPAHQSILLFGGTLLTNNSTQTNETWSWNGQTWQQLHPASAPPALEGTMVYDASSQQIVLLLSNVQSGNRVANEMWTWDGNNWQQLQVASMPEVIGASMVYDAAQHQIVLFGGETPHGQTGTLTNATWTWNGTSWQQVHSPTAPSPRSGAALAYDAAHQQVVLYGGTTAQGISGETWLWNGKSWQKQVVTNGPTLRQHALLAYDSATQQTLLFSGLNQGGTQSAPGDTWTWNGSSWKKVASQGTPTDLYESAAYDEATRTVTVYAVQGTINKLAQSGISAPTSQTWLWNGSSWQRLA
jgi:hypothetical protein